MHTIKLSDIIIRENRQRQEFDPTAMQELIESIRVNGLLHAPVLRREPEGWVLVAGERRLRALEEIFTLGGEVRYNEAVYTHADAIPFVSLGELSVLEAEEAELDENLKRRDLTWQEHAAAVERLHVLRVAQKVEQVKTLSPLDATVELPAAYHTIADTAEELTGRRDGSYQDSVRKELIVARHLSNPSIAKAKSADEAYKILKREESLAQHAELARVVGATFSASRHQLHNVDCLDWMPSVAAEQFDVILTDPPYGMNADAFGDAAGKLSGITHSYDDSPTAWRELMGAWAPEAFRLAKPQAHAYVFCDIDNFLALRDLMRLAGWYVFRTPLILHKVNSGRVPLPDRGPRRQWEMILYAIKGNKPVTHIYPDVITATGDENLSHGAQKPIAVFQNLLQRSVRPGDRILDSFCGTGTIFPAAHTYKCEAVGLELDPASYGIAVKRLQELKALEQGVEIKTN